MKRSGAERRRQWLASAGAAALIAVVGYADHVTGPEIAFQLFYLAVVAFSAWYSNSLSLSAAVAVLGALAWLGSEWLARGAASQLVLLWNAGSRLVIFVLAAVLLVKLKRAMLAERALARTDHLTGASNSRAFEEALSLEILKSARYGRPMAVAYVDLDDFKKVNDERGHKEGDKALCAVVEVMQTELRESDVIARLGGDEFALLFPETDEEAAASTLERLRYALLGRMDERGWPITFSIGAVVFEHAPDRVADAIAIADALMYRVKAGGKNRVTIVRSTRVASEA